MYENLLRNKNKSNKQQRSRSNEQNSAELRRRETMSTNETKVDILKHIFKFKQSKWPCRKHLKNKQVRENK